MDNAGIFSELPTSIWTLVDPATVEPIVSTSSGGGGGCALNAAGQGDPDPIFLLLMLAVLGYGFRKGGAGFKAGLRTGRNS